MKKIVAINAGPRIGFNTDQLIRAAVKGAENAGAEVEYIFCSSWRNTPAVSPALPASCLRPTEDVCAETD